MTLRPITVSDAETCFRWVSDPQVQRYLGLMYPVRTFEQERAWIAGIIGDRDHQRAFMIETAEGMVIGTCGVRGIDQEQGTAHFGIMIGDPRRWDHGYGAAATLELLAYAFGELGLREVRLSCHPDNGRAIRCYEKAGFVRCAAQDSSQGARPDEVRMAIDRDRWRSLAAQG